MQSIYLEMTILVTCFAVTLAAIWRLHQAENTRLALALDDAGEIRKTARQWQRTAVSWQSECRRLTESATLRPFLRDYAYSYSSSFKTEYGK